MGITKKFFAKIQCCVMFHILRLSLFDHISAFVFHFAAAEQLLPQIIYHFKDEKRQIELILS